ncbi:MAG TPA: DUF308 domain-containing protein, partial [Pilimelia sp.]|nr:DUF308 domain-containing protein [Pilimelia sp.]
AGAVGIVGGFVVFLAPGLLPVGEDLGRLIGFVAVLAGFATLIMRLRPGGDEDDDLGPDDGAVV